MKIRHKFICLTIISILLVGCTNLDKQLLKASQLIDSGSYEKGIKIYDSLIEKDEGNSSAYIGLADAYSKLGKKNFEESILKKGMANCENNEEVYERLIELYVMNDENDKFLKLYEECKDIIYSEKAIVNASRIYEYEGNRELAFKELETLDIGKVKDAEVLEELAPYYFDDNNLVELERIVNKGIEINKEGTILFTYKYLLDNLDKFVVQTLSSADLDNDGIKENIFVITDEDKSYNSTYTKLVVQNGRTGEIIDSNDIENFYEFFYIETGNLFDDKGLNILLNAHPGGSGTPSNALLYGFNNNKLSEIEYKLEDDIEINYFDGFKLEIGSRQFDRLYAFEIDQDVRAEYIEWGYYTSSGKFLGNEIGYGLEQIDVYPIEKLKKDGLIYILPYYGSYMSKDYIGDIKVIYSYDGSWKPYDMYIIKNDGEPMEYRKYAEKTESPKVLTMNDTLEETKRIVNMTRSQVYEKFGQPNSIDSYQTEYLIYDDKYIFIYDNKVSAMWWLNPIDKFGIKGKLTNKKVKDAFGKPIWEGVDESGLGEYILNYKIDNLDMYFSDLDEDYGGFINIIKR